MMANSMHSENTGASNAGWMLTFADLLSLMLTFFVLVFSMSTIHHDSWNDVVETMRDQFDPTYSSIRQRTFENKQAVARTSAHGLNLNYLKALIERDMENNKSLRGAIVSRERDRVIVSIPASFLFENKSGQFLAGAPQALAQFSGSLVQIKNKMVIASHTNDLPVANSKYRSNWELSVTRAQLVAGVLVDAGYIFPVSVIGHGDSKFRIDSDARATVSQLDAQERIDFVILAEGKAKGVFDVF